MLLRTENGQIDRQTQKMKNLDHLSSELRNSARTHALVVSRKTRSRTTTTTGREKPYIIWQSEREKVLDYIINLLSKTKQANRENLIGLQFFFSKSKCSVQRIGTVLVVYSTSDAVVVSSESTDNVTVVNGFCDDRANGQPKLSVCFPFETGRHYRLLKQKQKLKTIFCVHFCV